MKEDKCKDCIYTKVGLIVEYCKPCANLDRELDEMNKCKGCGNVFTDGGLCIDCTYKENESNRQK